MQRATSACGLPDVAVWAPNYHGTRPEGARLALNLVVGPANAGKVALLLERYLACLDDEPVLIVPNRADVARVERDLLERAGCLFGGSIGTFDDLFARIADGDPGSRPVASRAQRALVAARAAQHAAGGELEASARFPGFTDALLGALADLEGGLLDPADLDGELGTLFAAYRDELDRLGLWDRDLLRRSACERLRGDFSAWHGEPTFAYGFEDLTAAEWSLLEALAARADVHVSLPYEPGRSAFASLSRTADDLAALAAGRTLELPPRSAEYAAPAIARLERSLFEAVAPSPEPIGGAVRFLAGAGLRGTVELVGDHVLAELRAGTAPEEIGVIVPTIERWREPLETVFATLEIPFGIESRVRFPMTPLGHALLSLLQFAWAGGGRRELYAFLRSPYSGVAALERRLHRGKAPRPRGLGAAAGRGGDRAAARGPAGRAAGPPRRRVAPRRAPGAPRLDDPRRVWARLAACGRPCPPRPRAPTGPRPACSTSSKP